MLAKEWDWDCVLIVILLVILLPVNPCARGGHLESGIANLLLAITAFLQPKGLQLISEGQRPGNPATQHTLTP